MLGVTLKKHICGRQICIPVGWAHILYVVWVVSIVTQRIGRSTYQHRNIKRGLVAMGCVVDAVRGYYPVINEAVQKGVGGIATLTQKIVYNGVPKYYTEMR